MNEFAIGWLPVLPSREDNALQAIGQVTCDSRDVP
jgi:hypothetical protein